MDPDQSRYRQHCLEQAQACLRMVALNISLKHNETFQRLAAHWTEMAAVEPFQFLRNRERL